MRPRVNAQRFVPTHALGNLLPPAVMLGLVVALWQIVVIVFRLPSFLLPGPLEVLQAAWQQRGELSQATLLTGAGAVFGLLLSCVVGSLIALVFAQSSLIRRSGYPYAIFLQTVPIVAIAPLIVTWFGTGFFSVVLVASILSLFPIITNTTVGLVSLEPGFKDLFQVFHATRRQTLFKLQIPNAIPYWVTGLRTSAGLAVVGAIVGEFFVGYGAERHGLGYIILYAGPQLKTDQLFAATIASALLGVIMFWTASLVGYGLLRRWHESPWQ